MAFPLSFEVFGSKTVIIFDSFEKIHPIIEE